MKFKNIDVLRGLAALAVTIFHLSNNSGLNGPTSHIGKFGYLGVEIFFVISGYIIPYSMARRDYRISGFLQFNAKRMLRLYPPYLAAILLTLLLMMITHRPLPAAGSLFTQAIYLNSILGYHWTSPVFWTLAIEVQFYILIGLCYPVLDHGSTLQQLLLSVFVLTIGFFVSSAFLPNWLGMFGMGILLFKKSEQQISMPVYWLCTAVLTGLIAYQNGLFEASTCLLTILFIIFVPLKGNDLITRSGLWLGSISYSLYLIHWDFGRTGVAISRYVPLLGTYEPIRFLFGIACSLGTAWVFNGVIELPAIKWSNRITYNKSKA